MLSETGRSGLLDAGYLKGKLCLPDGSVPLMTVVFGYAQGLLPPMPPKLPSEQIFFNGKYSPRTTKPWKTGYHKWWLDIMPATLVLLLKIS